MQFDLVFEGGGAKGMVFVGALQTLEALGLRYGRLLGTSAGAITATFVAAGYSGAEMEAALSEKDSAGRPVFTQFLGKPAPYARDQIANSRTMQVLRDIDLALVPDFVEEQFDRLLIALLAQDTASNLFSLLEEGGWYAADGFVSWLERKLDEGHAYGRLRAFSRMTMAQFYAATRNPLSLVAADTTDRRLLVLNHKTAPDCPVVMAVRMSMSLPLVWQEVIWQPAWGRYLGQSLAGHQIVDGGLLSNFPIELFLSNDPHVTALMGERTSEGTLGFLIDESLPVPGTEASGDDRPPGFETLPLPARIAGLIDTATQAHDKMVIEAFEQYVCRLPAKGYQTTDFGMSDERRAALLEAGRLATAAYFNLTESEGLIGPDAAEMARAAEHADRIAGSILMP